MPNLTLDEAHELEDELKEALERKDPKNPALKFYPSTWNAIDGYYQALYDEEVLDGR